MRALAAVTTLILLSGCAERETLSQCPRNQPALALNAPALAPSVWDNGNETFLQFLGNATLPAITVVDPDGLERPANYTAEPGGVVMIHQTAPEIRLRDGKKVTCIVNRGWSAVGHPTGTGTISPDVIRLPRTTADER